jgi:hypothetical protein
MSNKIDNSALVLELFAYKKGLTLEQEDIERQINFHLELFQGDNTGKVQSQKNIVRNLSEKLEKETFDLGVKELLERVNTVVKENELFYELEDLFRVLENNNQGQVLRPIMKVVLDIINEGNEREQQVKILNELSLYDWNPAVKNFLFKYTTDPRERQNITSQGGKADAVYSIVEKISTKEESGFLTYIGDKWFFINEDRIEPSAPSDYITETEDLHKLNLLQQALKLGTIANDMIIFNVQEDLNLGISLKNKDIYINEEKSDTANIESIFESSLIPFMRRDLYPVISAVAENKDKFVDLDIVQKISNVTNPFLESFVFNYKDKMYAYSMSKTNGHHFHQYESATMLVNEIQHSLGFDLSQFLKDKFNDETQAKMDLEGKEKFITHKLSEISESLVQLEMCGLLESSEEIKIAYTALKQEEVSLNETLAGVKGALANGKYKIG